MVENLKILTYWLKECDKPVGHVYDLHKYHRK
jgi:hypothetical protein